MQAVVLVGGEGTRLRPLTYSRPKALVPVLGRPFLERFIERLRDHGFDEIVLAVSHGRDAVAATLGAGAGLGVRITYAAEPAPLGSAGAVRNCARFLRRETFLVANGDILSDIDLTAMLAQHRASGALVTIALTAVDDTSGYGVVDIDERDRIHRFVEKPPPEEAPSAWINAGLWLFEPAALDRIPEGHSMVETGLFPEIIASGQLLSGYRSTAYWLDLGTPQRYLQAHHDLMRPADGVGAEGAVVAAGARVQAPVIVARGAIVRDGARVDGPAYIGEGCDIAAGAEVRASVLWERVRVEQGARVHDSAIAEDVVIGAGAFVEGAVLGHAATVAAGARTPHGLRLDPGERYPAE